MTGVDAGAVDRGRGIATLPRRACRGAVAHSVSRPPAGDFRLPVPVRRPVLAVGHRYFPLADHRGADPRPDDRLDQRIRQGHDPAGQSRSAPRPGGLPGAGELSAGAGGHGGREGRGARDARDRPGSAGRCWNAAASTSFRCSNTWRSTTRIAAFANPRSSTGRLDVFTRLIADRSSRFDAVARGYHGRLYAEVSPRTFSILVRKGSRLNQLRLHRGTPAIPATRLRQLQQDIGLVDPEMEGSGPREGGLPLRLDLEGDAGNSADRLPRQAAYRHRRFRRRGRLRRERFLGAHPCPPRAGDHPEPGRFLHPRPPARRSPCRPTMPPR